jgi:hypothetical protein
MTPETRRRLVAGGRSQCIIQPLSRQKRTQRDQCIFAVIIPFRKTDSEWHGAHHCRNLSSISHEGTVACGTDVARSH